MINHLFDIVYRETRPPGSTPDSPVSPTLTTAASQDSTKKVSSPMAPQTTRHTLLNLDTPLHSGLPSTYIVGHLYELLAADSRTASLDCELAVGGSRVLVKGEIHSQDQYEAINEVIAKAAPEFDVENQTRITPLRPLAPAEEVI